MNSALLLNAVALFVFCIESTSSDRFITQLLENLLMDYNKNVRPVKNASDSLKVKFGASLCRLIDVDEVNQVLTTSLWLEMQWNDRKLVWNPDDFGGVKSIHIPSDQIWTPDILLYNNADGEPYITIDSLARVDHKGTVLWQPPSIYKSLCPINIEYFPYDSQECHLKFGGWSNDGQTLDLEMIPVRITDKPELREDESGQDYLFLEHGLGLSFYHQSAEWDLLRVTSSRYAQIYPGCCGQQYYIDIRYNIVIRRKAIFFTVMLTIPCMLIANLTSFVFMIPPNEHKITFSISTFVAFTVFYMVLIELIPPTSLVLPLIGKLLFTILMITVSILLSVLNINIYRRLVNKGFGHSFRNLLSRDGSFLTISLPGHETGSGTKINLRWQAFASEMSNWQRWLFVKKLPRYLRLKSLESDDDATTSSNIGSSTITVKEMQDSVVSDTATARLAAASSTGNRGHESPVFHTQRLRLLSLVEMDLALKCRNQNDNLDLFRRIAGNLRIIAANFHNQQMEGKINIEYFPNDSQECHLKITDEWRLMSLCIDRMFLFIYLVINMAATIWLIYNAPSLFDARPSLEREIPFKPLSGDSIIIT